MTTFLLLTVLGIAAPRGESACAGEAAARAAVVQALAVDRGVHLRTEACHLLEGRLVDEAIAEPGARLGRSARFRLLQDGRSVGYLIATVSGTVAHLRATRALSAGALLTDEDVEEVEADLAGQLLRRLPVRREVVGMALGRPLAAGQVIIDAVVKAAPAVRSGDRVVVRSVFGPVEARATATAQQSGGIGDVIRVVNAESRRPLRARIVAKGEVEVIHGS